MFKRIMFAICMATMIGSSFFVPASSSYAKQVDKKEHLINKPVTEKEVREGLKKQGVSDEEITTILNRPKEGGDVEVSAVSYANFNQSCAFYAFDWYYMNYGSFNHWFTTTTYSYVNDYYGFESRANGGWWYSSAPAGSYYYAAIAGNPAVGHGNYGCGS